ncbi:hypothetical protein JX266_007385 [Neoarthrinium moseri]|uniref:uncharacterized protein n=1 Tax=Neoarthrinium moseri TaxID=1658444 RepID=UPI001FDD315C|nr:uncharacterized protein JN550_012677 [Neoarthrinium moseri]KAI1846488.1 hypothetical protein JX266_007385 [Neoarthrinium moseri]KAI1858393.1 hypothetical protein JN550_012677 [Neoarthrinium moseri]
MADGTQNRGDERTPLLGSGAGGRDPGTEDNTGGEAEDFADLNRQVKSWKRRRWISFVASLFLIYFHARKANYTWVTDSSFWISGSSSPDDLSPDYQSIDPCTNFDQLVCQGWQARHDIPEDRSSSSTLSLMAEEGQTTIRHILEGSYPGQSKHSSFSPMRLASVVASTDEENFNVMKVAYNACINETAIKQVGVQPLVDLIREVAEVFPVVDGSDTANEVLGKDDYARLSDTILLLEKWGVSTFEELGTGADDKDPELVIIQASPGGISLPSPEYYDDKDTIHKYEETLSAVFGKLLPNKKAQAQADKLAKSVVELEKKIAAVTPPPEDQQDVTKYYNIAKVSDAGKIGPALRYDLVLKSLVPSSYTTDTMLLAFPEFLANVSQILTETSKSTIQAYLIWNVITAHHNHVESSEVEPVSRFFNVLAGKEPDTKSERWKTCSGVVGNQVGWILSRFFIEKAFSEDAKKFGDQIIMEIKQQFISTLNGLSWMDDSVKTSAIRKVNLIDQKIGYPTESPDIMSPEALRDYYQGLVISESFFNNSISSNLLSVNKTWSALGKPVDHGKWEMLSTTVNAYYSPVGAEIVFPAAIMQFPVFQVDLPSYISYGAFAAVAGHELSHGFDSSGRYYDEHGKYTDWWTNHTVEEFTKRADCFVDQYSNFTVDVPNGKPLHVNGRLTLGENIADAGGLAAAFRAWKQRQQSSPDEDLPGLDHFSHEQLFFIFYANCWCGKIRPQQAVQYIYTDPHSPTFARILGTTANSRAFREAFSCPVKEPTCELW